MAEGDVPGPHGSPGQPCPPCPPGPPGPPGPPALTNTPAPPGSAGPLRAALLNLLIGVSFMAFAFSGYWVYKVYRDRAAAARAVAQHDAAEHAALGSAPGVNQLQAGVDSALAFLKQRPEFHREVGDLRHPEQALQWRVQATDELGDPDDVKFRITLRGTTSDAWYDCILRPAQGRWTLLAAMLTVPDAKAPDGRREIHLLDPAPAPAPAASASSSPSAYPSAAPTAAPPRAPAPTATPTATPAATPAATPTATPAAIPAATPTPAPGH